MRIYIDKTTGRGVLSEKFNSLVSLYEFKRGDTTRIEIGYVQDGGLVALEGGYSIIFGIKEAGKYDGDYLVHESTFAYNALTGFYEGEPNFNTTELNDLLNADDGDDTNDIAKVDCLFEITATDDNGIFSSATSTARVHHDVNKGNEGIPTGANPSYALVNHTHVKADVDGLQDDLDNLEDQMVGRTLFRNIDTSAGLPQAVRFSTPLGANDRGNTTLRIIANYMNRQEEYLIGFSRFNGGVPLDIVILNHSAMSFESINSPRCGLEIVTNDGSTLEFRIDSNVTFSDSITNFTISQNMDWSESGFMIGKDWDTAPTIAMEASQAPWDTGSGTPDVYNNFADGGIIAGKVQIGTLNLSNLTEYADDTAAGVGGLVAGDVYTTSGALKIKT